MCIDSYLFSKLSNINRRISLHEGDANRRLASQAPNILAQLFSCSVPKEYEKKFKSLILLIEATINEADGKVPVRINRIQNRTASKYIKLLIEMEEYYEEKFDLVK